MDRKNFVRSSNARLLHRSSYSHKDPAHVTKDWLQRLVDECERECCDRHVEQVNRRSDIEYPDSVLLKALHLVHAHHRHKTCKEVKRGRVWSESEEISRYQPISVRHPPKMNMRSTAQTRENANATEFGKVSTQVPLSESFLNSSFSASDIVL